VCAVNFNDLSSALIHISIRVYFASPAFRTERRMAETPHSAFTNARVRMSSRFYGSIKSRARRRESFGAEISAQRFVVTLTFHFRLRFRLARSIRLCLRGHRLRGAGVRELKAPKAHGAGPPPLENARRWKMSPPRSPPPPPRPPARPFICHRDIGDTCARVHSAPLILR